MSFNVSILLKTKSQRAIYSFRTIFLDILGFDSIEFFIDSDLFLKNKGVKISYDIYLQDVPYLASGTNLLYESTINDLKPEDVGYELDLKCFYRHSDLRSLLPFDFPAMAFWLLTRYEEYQTFQPDQHGRFPAKQSLAYQNNFLDMPLIDLWALELKEKLYSFYPESAFPKTASYTFQPTFDIDYAWAYRNKSFWRTSGAFLRDFIRFDFAKLSERAAVLAGKREDPYFTFSIIDEMHQATSKPIFFWLLGDYGKYDKNTHFKNSAFRKLIESISLKQDVGIHPSYASNEKPNGYLNELTRLEEICKNKISKSRQHFLKIKLPNTYKRLLQTAIRDEYSMGYADVPGFRASIARSYNWYDLSEEIETKLRIHPFMIMDVTLNVYGKMGEYEAIETSKKIIEHCKKVGGELITIWHNNSLCEKENWKGWTKTYQTIVEFAQNK
jgi:hypothetical protein